jgi:hypothetical protein
MFWVCATLSAAGVLESVICSCLLAELAGYRVRRILRRDQLSAPIGCYIGHQFLRYGPRLPSGERVIGEGSQDGQARLS